MQERLESLWKIYETTGEWVRFSDTKASAILATEGVAASIILPQIPFIVNTLQNNILGYLLFTSCLISALVAFYFAARSLLPIIGVQDIVSVIFFAQIARRYARPSDYESAVRQLFVDDNQIEAQVAQEIWSLSHIAVRKYGLVNKSILFFVITVFLSVITALFIVI